MNKTIRMVVIVGVTLLVLTFAKNLVAQTVISGAVEALTGLQLKMSGMDVGITKTTVGVKGLRLLNPRGFSERVMINAPELYVDYDLGSFLKGKTHLEEVRFDLKELKVIKNKKGELNINALKFAKKKEVSPEKKEKKAPPELRIDVLDLKIGRVIYKDESLGGELQIQEFDINIHDHYENITNLNALASIIMVRALAGTTIARLANFDLGPLKDAATVTLNKASTIVEGAVGKETLAAGKGAAKTAVKATKDIADETVHTLKKLLPFGE